VALSLAVLLSSLGTSIANVGLPVLAQAFGASFQQVQWVVLAYLLAVTTSIVGAGRLGDMLGRRRLLLAGLALFTASSLMCGIAPSLDSLIAARAFQGLGAAFMMALALAMVGEIVPKEKAGSAMGLLGTMSAAGTALGPAVGGAIVAAAGWRGIFLLNLPLGMLAWRLALRHLPADPPRAAMPVRSFDLRGTLLLGLALGIYAFAMTPGKGGLGLINLALLPVAAAAAGSFLRSQKHAVVPLIRLEMLRAPGLRQGLGANLLVSAVMMATLVVGPFYLSRGLGLSAAATGFVLSVGPLVAALSGVPAGRLADRVDARLVAIAGLLAMAAACLALAVVPPSLDVMGYVLPMGLLTAGYALFQTANNKSVMAGAGIDRGLVSGLLNLSRNLGLVTGASLLGAIFAALSGEMNAAAPAAVTYGMHATFCVAALLVAVALGLALAGRRRVHPQPR
jgi:MFS family permease